MSDRVVAAAAQSAVRAAQAEGGGREDEDGLLDLLSAVTLAYGYVRGALEAVGVADEKLNAAEDVGARIAQDMDRIRRARIAEGMAQA
jgi:hypothetical protein